MHFTVTQLGLVSECPGVTCTGRAFPSPVPVGAKDWVTSGEGYGSSRKLFPLHPATSSQLPSSIFGQEKDPLFRNCFRILSFWLLKNISLAIGQDRHWNRVTSCSWHSGSSGGTKGQRLGLEGRVASGTILLLVLGKDTLLQVLLAQGCTLWISSGPGSAEIKWNSIPRERKKWDQKASGGNCAGCAQPAAALNPRAASTSRVPTPGPTQGTAKSPSEPALTSRLPGAPSAQAEET